MSTKTVQEVGKDVADVRRTGLVNMFDRKGVVNVLDPLGNYVTVSYTQNGLMNDYICLLKESGEE